MNEMTRIKNWYLDMFPEDEMGNDLVPTVTFLDLFEALDAYEDIYVLLFGDEMGGDSLIRERIFEQLAEIMDVSYDYIYDQWLLGAEMNEGYAKEGYAKESNEIERFTDALFDLDFIVGDKVIITQTEAPYGSFGLEGEVVDIDYDNGTWYLVQFSPKNEQTPYESFFRATDLKPAQGTKEEGYAKETYTEAGRYESRIEDYRLDSIYDIDIIIEALYNKSALTFEGLAEESIPDALEYFIEEKGQEDAFANIFSGEQFNDFFELSENNAYPNDLVIVVFENTGTVLAMAIGARWLDDIVNNNADRSGYHPFNDTFFEAAENPTGTPPIILVTEIEEIFEDMGYPNIDSDTMNRVYNKVVYGIESARNSLGIRGSLISGAYTYTGLTPDQREDILDVIYKAVSNEIQKIKGDAKKAPRKSYTKSRSGFPGTATKTQKGHF